MCAVGRSGSLDSPFPVLEADPSAVGSPPSSFPSCRKGLWVFQLWNRKEVGILFTSPLSCSHLFRAPPCPVLLVAVPLLSVLSLLCPPALHAASCGEVLRCHSWTGLQNPTDPGCCATGTWEWLGHPGMLGLEGTRQVFTGTAVGKAGFALSQNSFCVRS